LVFLKKPLFPGNCGIVFPAENMYNKMKYCLILNHSNENGGIHMDKLLELLEQDCSMTTEQLATIAGMSEADVKAAIHKYEEERVILGYKAIIDWDRVHKEAVTALIEVNVVPQSADGFDRIAERIYQYDEVESMYLMSGAFDLTVIISGRTLREVALFVSERLSTIQGVTGTATHFILKKYKEKHLVFRPQDPEEREYIFV